MRARLAFLACLSKPDEDLAQLRGAKLVLLAQDILRDIARIEARLAGREGFGLRAALSLEPSPTRLERLLRLCNLATDLLAAAEAADTGPEGAQSFDRAAVRFVEAQEEVLAFQALLEASADLPQAA